MILSRHFSWMLVFLVCGLSTTEAIVNDDYLSELIDELPDGLTIENDYHLPLPRTYISKEDLPKSFWWGDVDGVSYLTRSLNQHIPQYCGSCWAHAALSALADRIKIARNASGIDINLSIQYILNCGQEAGSCHGGNPVRTYQFIQKTLVPYDSCQPYISCSSDSDAGFCASVDTTCTPINTCRTCTPGGQCSEIDVFPNATVDSFGTIINDVHATQAEIFARGPVVAGLSGQALSNYTGGVFSDVTASKNMTHAVSIVGWGTDAATGDQHWIVRNSWGQYWGEMGYFRVLMGHNVIGIETKIIWATPGNFTVMNYPCFVDGKNCAPSTQTYMDPFHDIEAVQRRLRRHTDQ
jgi:cathepsin X